MIPRFQNTLEEAIWASAYARFLTDIGNMTGSRSAWTLADRVVESFRDEAHRRSIESAEVIRG